MNIPPLNALVLAALLLPLQGSAQRDPTRSPEALNAASAASAAPAASGVDAGGGSPPVGNALQHRMVLNGKPYLVERGWLRGVGDRLGDARIERITDTEVWLREAGQLRKQPLYPQVSVQPARPAAPASATPGRRPRGTAAATSSAPKETQP